MRNEKSKRANNPLVQLFSFFGLQQAESDEIEKQIIVSKGKEIQNTDSNKAHHPQRISLLFII
jgi:hypothetical protein